MILTGHKEMPGEYYDAIYKKGYNTAAFQTLYKGVVGMVKKMDSPNVLEVGCGVGDLGKMFVEEGIPYRGFDFSSEAINCSKELCPTGNFWNADAYDSENYIPHDYNVVIALEVLEHLDDLKIIRNIPPGVHLIASIPNHNDISHLRLCEDPKIDIVERFSAYMKVPEIYELAGSKDPSMVLYLFHAIMNESK